MKKVMMFLVLAGLVTGLAQAQGVQVKKLWEKTLPESFSWTVDDQDTLNGPTFIGWHTPGRREAGNIVTIDREGNASEITQVAFQTPKDTTMRIMGTSLSRRGKYILQRWYRNVYQEITPFRMDIPVRVEVRDRTDKLILVSDNCRADVISDNGALVWPGRNVVEFYDLDGRIKGKVNFEERRVLKTPVYVSEDGSCALVYVGEHRSRSAVVADSSGRINLEVPGVEENYAMRPDGAVLLTRQIGTAAKSAMFYNREGKLQATWSLNGIGESYDSEPAVFSEEGSHVVVYTSGKLDLLQIAPPRVVWEYTNSDSHLIRFKNCLVGPSGLYLVTQGLFHGKKIETMLFNRSGKLSWRLSDYSPLSLVKDYLLVGQGNTICLYKVSLQ